MRRKYYKLAVITILFLLVGVWFAAAWAAEKPTKWRFAILYPRATGFAEIYENFTQHVDKMSGGRLKIEVAYAGEGVAENQILGGVGSGLVEMGNPYQALHVGELPCGVVELGLPAGPSSFDAIRVLFKEAGWDEVLRQAYATQNCYWINVASQPSVYLITKKPVESLDGLKKMKIRAPGAYGKMLGNLGVSTVVTDISEVYTSLATGLIDGVLSANLLDYRDLKWYEMAKWLYPLPAVGAQTTPMIANLDSWNELPEDLKAIVLMASNEFTLETMRKAFMWEGAALSEMKSKGLQIGPQPSEADRKKWFEAGKRTWDDFAKKDKFSEELIKIQVEFLEKYGN